MNDGLDSGKDYSDGTLYCDKSAEPFICKVMPSTVVHCSQVGGDGCVAQVCQSATGKCAIYPNNHVTNPGGPGGGSKKLYRGGSFWDNWQGVRTSGRNVVNTGAMHANRGFRCCRSAP